MSDPILVAPPAGAAERFRPPVSAASEPFWEATRVPRLVLQWCRSCERPVHFPREACPTCLGTELEFRPASVRATVHAVSVMAKPANPTMDGRGPYAVALVDLAEGVRMLTNVISDEPATVAVGDAVSVAWEPLSDGRHLPVFVLDPSR
jgi:uncharacterized OB-fold protein